MKSPLLSPSWATLCQPSVLLAMLAALGGAFTNGCGSEVVASPNGETSTGPGGQGPGAAGPGAAGPGAAGPGGAGPGGGIGTSSCDTAGVDPIGLPCTTEGESCSWGWECTSCELVCQGGVWQAVECDDGVPDCSASPPPSGSFCDEFCGLPQCSYTIETPCGAETVQALCGPVGWSYPVQCPGDCTAYGSADQCAADPACVWIGNCDGGPNQCVRNTPCTKATCPAGQTCAELGINPCDPAALECENCGALVKLCVPTP